jgi:molybdate transport system ATP-binding protein
VEAEGEPRTLLSSPAVVDEAAAGLENLLPGHVIAHDADGGITRVRTEAGFDVSITLAAEHPVGAAVTLTVRSEDILVCQSPVEGLSARNVYPAWIVALERTGPDIVVRGELDNDGSELLARVTPAAVAALELAPGRRVWLAVKSHSIRVV